MSSGLPRVVAAMVLPWLLSCLLSLQPHGARADDVISPSDDKAAPADEPVQKASEEESDQQYYELLKLFADALDQVDRNYVKEIDRRVLIEGAIEGMMAKLDPYSDYIAPSQQERFKSSVESQYGGIGIQIELVDGQLIISSSMVGGPAYRAGLLAGDKIVKIGEETTEGITRSQAVEKLKGPLGTSVTFTVQHPDQSHTETVSLTREVIRLDTVLGDHRRRDHTWEFMLDPEKKIGYVRLTAFSDHTAAELRKAVTQLLDGGMKGLVLDLRDNPGGKLLSAVEVADLFIKEGRIVSTAGRSTPEKKYDAHADATLPDFPLAVLVNNYSASASEIVAACLQDHERATVVGERTWGKGSVQTILELEHGKSALKLTTAGYLRPSGKNIHRLPDMTEADEWGVQPNEGYEVTLAASELQQLRDYRKEHDVARRPGQTPEEASLPTFIDSQLQRAIACLDEKLAAPAETARAE